MMAKMTILVLFNSLNAVNLRHFRLSMPYIHRSMSTNTATFAMKWQPIACRRSFRLHAFRLGAWRRTAISFRGKLRPATGRPR